MWLRWYCFGSSSSFILPFSSLFGIAHPHASWASSESLFIIFSFNLTRHSNFLPSRNRNLLNLLRLNFMSLAFGSLACEACCDYSSALNEPFNFFSLMLPLSMNLVVENCVSKSYLLSLRLFLSGICVSLNRDFWGFIVFRRLYFWAPMVSSESFCCFAVVLKFWSTCCFSGNMAISLLSYDHHFFIWNLNELGL
jgi:hypothetical protein